MLDAIQQEAVQKCADLSIRFVAVTGPAGSGKTTLIKQLCQQLTEQGVSFALAAPTGKAARRIKEATGFNAMTIHKLLEFNRPDMDEETGEAISTSRPNRGPHNLIEQRVVICDEYAMVSTGLHRDLVSSIGPSTAFRVFGDIKQLPPIENSKLADPESPFSKSLKHKNAIVLRNIYRQEDGNGILEAARCVSEGNFFSSNADVMLKFNDSMVKVLLDEVRTNTEKWRSLDHQIISPVRKSDVGTVKLNAVLQGIINPDGANRIQLPRHKWEVKNIIYASEGDKVVCTSNTYDMRDYGERYAVWHDSTTPDLNTYIPCPETKMMLNGEIGIITTIDPSGRMEVDFGDRVVEIPESIEEYSVKYKTLFNVDNRRNIELAYALTTHKCQGSEYKEVAYIMASAAFFALSRQNFYTGITRARSRVTVYTDQRAFSTAIRKKINIEGNTHASIIR